MCLLFPSALCSGQLRVLERRLAVLTVARRNGNWRRAVWGLDGDEWGAWRSEGDSQPAVNSGTEQQSGAAACPLSFG